MSTLFIVIIYCEAYSEGWDEKFKSYLKMLKTGKGETGQRYTQRYVGLIVGDVSIEYCLFKCCVSYDMIAFRNPKIEYCQKLTTANSFTKIKTMLHQVHRTLMYGGIFCCPSDTEVHHKGNLQLVYKSNPMVYILEHARGKATNGYVDLLSVQPDYVHERSPCFMGSREDMDEMMKHLSGVECNEKVL